MSQMEFDFGVCALADYDADDHPQIQTDSPGIDDEQGTTPAESLGLTGYYARPLDPDKGPDGEIGLGAAVLTITHGDRRHVLPLGDPRDVEKKRIPKLKKGGRMVAGGAGEHRSFFLIDGLDPTGAKQPGSVMISASYTKGGAKKSLGISMNVRDSGKEDVSIVHGDGARITVGSDGVVISSPNGKHYLEVGSDGLVLAGTTRVQGSLTVGEQGAAQAGVDGTKLAALLTQLIGIVAAITPVTSGAPAAGLAPQVAGILTKHSKST